MSQQQAFDPSRYLTKVGSADYLEIKWRLVWLRELHPDAEIVTSLYSHDDQLAVFSANVHIPGGGSATGWGSEGYNDFRDYLEKAETKALGRALAALGFGTQFCGDFEFGASNGNVVDSPIDFASTRGRRMDNQSNGHDEGDRRVASLNLPVTPRQLKFIQAIAREKGMSDDELNQEIEKAYGKATVAELDRRDASAFIERLQTRRPAMDFPEGATATPAPARETVTSAPSAPKTEHELALDRFFAVSSERGFTDAGNKLFAIANVPSRENGPTTSRKQVTAQELRDLATWMENDIEPAARDEHNKILFVSPPVEFANAIADATNQTRLADIGARVSSGGISAPWLRKMFKHRREEVPALSDTQPSLVDAPGTAGNDRFTS